VNISETQQWRRGGRRSSTNSFVNFDIRTGSETVTMKLSSKNANRLIHILYVCVCVCVSFYYFKKYFTCVSKTCFIYDTFFKVHDEVISDLNLYSLFTVLILFVIHYTCNYLSNAPFYLFLFSLHPSPAASFFEHFPTYKKEIFQLCSCVSSCTKIPSLSLCTFPNRVLRVMY
jgi:hypothetical protein